MPHSENSRHPIKENLEFFKNCTAKEQLRNQNEKLGKTSHQKYTPAQRPKYGICLKKISGENNSTPPETPYKKRPPPKKKQQTRHSKPSKNLSQNFFSRNLDQKFQSNIERNKINR